MTNKKEKKCKLKAIFQVIIIIKGLAYFKDDSVN